jgi:transposase
LQNGGLVVACLSSWFVIIWDDIWMARDYRRVDRDQLWLFPPSLTDLLGQDHPVFVVIEAVRHLDTRAFHAGRRTGGAGAAGYDPDMLVTLLVWAYANGVTSSRRIEQLCGTDAAFMAVCGAGQAPDHVTIARFRAGFAGAAGEFFAQVLGLCAELGMGRLGVVALDGTKIAASAAKGANRSEERLAELAAQAVTAHGEADADEDALFGAGRRGDEVPADAWSPRRRGERVAAALASLRARRAGAEAAAEAEAGARTAQFRQRREAGQRTGPAPAAGAVELAREKLARAIAAQQARCDDWDTRNAAKIAKTGTGLSGPRPADPDGYVRVRQARAHLDKVRARAAARQARKARQDQPAPVRNVTDPDSRLMPVRGGGFIQGYNAQNVTSQDGLIIATALTQDTADTAWFQPMLAAAETAAALITARQPPPPAAPGTSPRSTTGEDQPASQDDQDDDKPAGYLPPAPDGTPGRYDGPIGLFLADAGYCSEASIALPGPPRLIATGKRRDLDQAARDGTDGKNRGTPHTTAMAALLTTGDGITAYRHRGHIAETPHGHIKHNMRFRQLTMRGTAKATAEWTFTTAVHNLFKAITTGALTTQALTALTH